MLASNRTYALEPSAMSSTTTTTTTTTTSPSQKRRRQDNDSSSDFSEAKRKRQSVAIIEAIKDKDSEETFDLQHQEVLLLHGVKQRYQHTKQHEIPKPADDGEMLVKVTVVGLNPIDWKAPDFGFGLPALPCIAGRDLAGTIVKAPKNSSRFRVGDTVMAVSTDYRDSRKAAYQEYAIVSTHNACRIPATLSPLSVAPLGVAYAAAALMLGICLGVDFSAVASPGAGPDLLATVRALDRGSVAADIRAECFEGIALAERPRRGDWLAIWGGSSATGCVALQLAKLAGLRVVCVLDVARNGARMLKLGADLLVDRLDEGRAVEIVRRVTGGELRFGIDTRGRESAVLLARAMEADGEGEEGGAEGKRAHLVGLTGLPKQPTRGVQYHTVPIKAFHEATEVGESLMVWVEKLLEGGLLHTPDIEVAKGGLGGINDALDRLRDGSVNGPRIVVPLVA